MIDVFEFEQKAQKVSPMTPHDYFGTRIGSNAKLHDELGSILPRLNELPQNLSDDLISEYHQITREIAGVLKRSPKLASWACLNPFGFEKKFEINDIQFHATAQYSSEDMIGGGLWSWQLSWFESCIREPAWSLANATDEIAAWRVFLNRRYFTLDYDASSLDAERADIEAEIRKENGK